MFILGILTSLWSGSISQNTVGVIARIDSLAEAGFNLFYPPGQPNVYLLDNCGRIMHTWADSADFVPGNWAILRKDGILVKGKRNSDTSNDPIFAGGGGAFLELRDWDNSILWSIEINDSNFRLHHDFVPLSNGNILAVVWIRKSENEAISAGRDTALLPNDEVWSEAVWEIQPIGTDSFDVVWEWEVWDHLVQDYDSSKANYGNPAENSELVNLNFVGSSMGSADWLHINSIDYNQDLDQILLSVPTFNEIWIIDHSMTTAEAASHSGGLSGIGGDLMFRWGNPMAYSRGDSTDTKLGFQHDAHWVEQQLNANEADFGKIMVFNNRIGGDYSTVDILQPDWNQTDWKYELIDSTFAPDSADWKYSAPNPQDFFSSVTSSAQRMKNGNTLVCLGRPGRVIELSATGEIVWEYRNPMWAGQPVNQGDTVLEPFGIMFRMHRYFPEYSGFHGKSMVAGDYVELNPDTTQCNLPVVGIPESGRRHMQVYPNPAEDYIVIRCSEDVRIDILDARGKMVMQTNSNRRTDMSTIPAGIYFIRSQKNRYGKFIKL